MSQQHLKLTKTSQSAAQPGSDSRDNPQQSYQDQSTKSSNAHLQKGKSDVQTFQKKLQRRDLNLIPPSAAIVQSSQQDPYQTACESSNNRSGYQLSLGSTQNKKQPGGVWDQIENLQHSRVTTVKHEKGLPNGTIMQCLKQFQRSKQQRTSHQPPEESTQTIKKSDHGGISLQAVVPVASQNVANMPISSKSNKSQKSTKTRTQTGQNASMAADVHAQRRQNFTVTATQNSLRLSKKSPSNAQQQRDRSGGAKQYTMGQNYQSHKTNARASNSQQPTSANEKIPTRSQQKNAISKKQQPGANKVLGDIDLETKFAMLMRIREERSNESKPEKTSETQKMMIMTNKGNAEPVKLISPNTTTNRHSSQEAKLLTLKSFMPAKQISSNIVSPKQVKCVPGEKQLTINEVNKSNTNREDSNDNRNVKVQSKSQVGMRGDGSRTKDSATIGASPETKNGPNGRVEKQQTKSLSNNSRQKYLTQQQNVLNTVTKTIKPQQKGGLNVKKSIGGAVSTAGQTQKPSAPQMHYSVPPYHKTQQAQVAQAAQQQVQSSSSVLNGSSELQKRFTRGEIGSQHEASVSSGKANKSFQFGHNTGLMSCSSGGDSANIPQDERHRSQSSKNGKQKIKISQIQHVNQVMIQPGTSTSAGVVNNEISYLNLKRPVPQSTTNQQQPGKRFTFAFHNGLNSNNQRDSQKASRPNKHSSGNATVKPGTNTGKVQQMNASQPAAGQGQPPNGQKSAIKGKSVSAKKGKGQGVQGSGPPTAGTSEAASKNLNFDKVQHKPAQVNRQSQKTKTPEELWYEDQMRAKGPSKLPQQKVGMMKHQIKRSGHDKSGRESSLNSSIALGSSQECILDNRTGGMVSQKKKKGKQQSSNISHGDLNPRDSIIDESSQELVANLQPSRDSGRKSELHHANVHRKNDEMQMKDNLIQQLYAALGRKDEQLMALSKNCEVLSSSLKERDQKRDRSQQAIKETLKNLEQKLQMFTEQSQHNQGGLRQITQSPLEMQRQGGMPEGQQAGAFLMARGIDPNKSTGADQNFTPNPPKQRNENLRQNFQTQLQQRPTSVNQLSMSIQLQVPNNQGSGGRRASQLSEIDSLVTVAEYNGTQWDGYNFNGSNYELSAAKKDFAIQGEGTIGSLGSEIQLINSHNTKQIGLTGEQPKFPMFKKPAENDAEEMGELTSLSEMEMSNVHDASLDQLERDLVETQHKLHDQSQRPMAAIMRTQQNNFVDLKVNRQIGNEHNVILEDAESAEDDIFPNMADEIAQLIPKRSGNNGSHLDQMHRNNLHSKKRAIKQLEPQAVRSQERKEMVSSTTHYQLTEQPGAVKMNSLQESNYTPGQANSNQLSKMSKTMSKNKMKLKLAAEILNLKKDQVVHEQKPTTGSTSCENQRNEQREKNLFVKKKIQLPLKSQKGSDSSRLVLQSKSQERGTISNNSNSGQYHQVFNSVTIRNIKSSIKGSNTAEENQQPKTSTHKALDQIQTQAPSLTHLPSKSPQSRQGVQIQGQGNMLSQRLNVKPRQQQQVQKIDKLTANQLLALQKLQHGQRGSATQQPMYDEQARRERR